MPNGIDVDRVSAWLQANVAGAEPPFTFEVIGGGRSNLTYTVTTTGTYQIRAGCYSSNSCSGTVAWTIQ